jgi:hypothetical protein
MKADLEQKALDVLVEIMEDGIADSHDRCVAAQTVLAHESFVASAKDQGAAMLGELRGIREVLSERVTLQ